MGITLKEIQNVELNIFKEFADICKKHSIEYYMAQGTLLGAVRHKAFIPWDDDIDVLMPYKEIERLAKIFKSEARAEYFLTNYKIEEHFPFTWSKIRDTSTVSMPAKFKDLPINWGICIDLFPVYSVSDNALIRKAEIFIFKIGRKILLSEHTAYEENAKIIDIVFSKLPVSIRKMAAEIGTMGFKRHKKDTENVYLTCKGGSVMKRDVIFGGNEMLEFEGALYPAPRDYDAFLTNMFGDYMTPPPEKERKGHELRLGDIIWKI